LEKTSRLHAGNQAHVKKSEQNQPDKNFFGYTERMEFFHLPQRGVNHWPLAKERAHRKKSVLKARPIRVDITIPGDKPRR
jgi:hypothetical protein